MLNVLNGTLPVVDPVLSKARQGQRFHTVNFVPKMSRL